MDPKVHGPDAVSRPRIEAYGDRPLPLPTNPAPQIVKRLMEIGPVEIAGMDRAPIGWASITAWREATGASLSNWEARLLRRLSVEYLNETHAAADEHCPAPWIPLKGR